MAKNVKRKDFISTGVVAQNRRANFDYLINEKFVAGLELTGTEVKSLRLGHANINDAYGIERNGEIFMSNMYIAEYVAQGKKMPHDQVLEDDLAEMSTNARELIEKRKSADKSFNDSRPQTKEILEQE